MLEVSYIISMPFEAVAAGITHSLPRQDIACLTHGGLGDRHENLDTLFSN